MTDESSTHHTEVIDVGSPYALVRYAVDQLESLQEGRAVESEEVAHILALLGAARDILGAAFDGILEQATGEGIFKGPPETFWHSGENEPILNVSLKRPDA